MKIFFTAVLLIVTVTLFSQENYVRWNENQQLTWDDFTGKVNDTSRFDAECFAEIRYDYKFYSQSDFEFDVYANFNRNTSWSRKEMQSKELLRHEQLHFNIAALFAEKLKKQFEGYSYTASYDSQILEVFNDIKLQYHEMQLKYDAETNHSLNKKKQKEWEERIESELRETRLSLQLAQNEKKNTERGE